MTYFITTIDLTIVNVSLPTIGRQLHFSATSLQWVATAYALTLGGFLLLGGRAADLLGRRRILMLGLGVFTTASLGCAVATSETLLIAMRAIQGLGAAIMLPAALSIVMNMFEEGAERNKALGIWGAVAGAGGAAGVLLGGILTEDLTWRWVLFVNVPIGIASALLAPRCVPESRSTAEGGGFDLGGALFSTAGFAIWDNGGGATLYYRGEQPPAYTAQPPAGPGWSSSPNG